MNIGEFARQGRVSVRMLRHYDALGLLPPAHVEPATGYRSYEVAQLARLNRIIALRDLGLSLRQISEILDERVDVEELRGMLRLRRAELAAAIAVDTSRLAQVEARLRTIETEGHMPETEVVVKSLPPMRLAELSAVAASFGPDDITPVIVPLYDELERRLAAAGVKATGPSLAYYEHATGTGGQVTSPAVGEGAVVVHAGCPVDLPLGNTLGFDVVDVPGVERAATVVHHGPVDTLMVSGQLLSRWVDANGYRPVGLPRELYLACPPDAPKEWVTELQEPITEA
jgi:DNA-binding transcriptional MerR regulator